MMRDVLATSLDNARHELLTAGGALGLSCQGCVRVWAAIENGMGYGTGLGGQEELRSERPFALTRTSVLACLSCAGLLGWILPSLPVASPRAGGLVWCHRR